MKEQKKLKLPEWQQGYAPEKLVIKLFVSSLLIPKFEIIIEENFHFTCIVYGWAYWPAIILCMMKITGP